MKTTTDPRPPGFPTRAAIPAANRDLESHGFFLMPLLQPGFDVLDAGCGLATITTGIAEHVFPARVTAVDPSPARLETARRLVEGREIMNINLAAASASHLPFADHSFDVVFAHAVLDTAPDPDQVLREFHRVTRPGGFLAVACADWDHFALEPASARVNGALQACRHLRGQGSRIFQTTAGLRPAILAAGFTPLMQDTWIERHDNPRDIVSELTASLDQTGQFHHATTLRDWADQPEARFHHAWRYATAVRADEFRPLRRVVE